MEVTQSLKPGSRVARSQVCENCIYAATFAQAVGMAKAVANCVRESCNRGGKVARCESCVYCAIVAQVVEIALAAPNPVWESWDCATKNARVGNAAIARSANTLHFSPSAVPRDLEGLTSKLGRRSRVIDIGDLCRAAPALRAFTAGGLIKKGRIARLRIGAITRLIIRQQSAQLAVGNFLLCGFLRHHAQLPPLDKLPRRRGILSKHQTPTIAPPTEMVSGTRAKYRLVSILPTRRKGSIPAPLNLRKTLLARKLIISLQTVISATRKSISSFNGPTVCAP